MANSPSNNNNNKSCYYLPKLLNPLIDSIFNCPDVNNSPLKKLYSRLKGINDFIVIVLLTDILLSKFDTAENSTLKDLCYYNVDFISNHIVVPDIKYGNSNKIVKNNNQLFYVQTVNNKNIVIDERQSCLFTSDGFISKQKYNILKFDTLVNFNNYYNIENNGNIYRKFILIYIDRPISRKDQNNLILRHESQHFSNIKNYSSPLPDKKFSFENMVVSNHHWLSCLNNLLIEYKNSCQH